MGDLEMGRSVTECFITIPLVVVVSATVIYIAYFT